MLFINIRIKQLLPLKEKNKVGKLVCYINHKTAIISNWLGLL
jgi:hypothetical protein